jgi:hypothetical protein
MKKEDIVENAVHYWFREARLRNPFFNRYPLSLGLSL